MKEDIQYANILSGVEGSHLTPTICPSSRSMTHLPLTMLRKFLASPLSRSMTPLPLKLLKVFLQTNFAGQNNFCLVLVSSKYQVISLSNRCCPCLIKTFQAHSYLPPATLSLETQNLKRRKIINRSNLYYIQIFVTIE